MDAIELKWPAPGTALVTIRRPERRNALRRQDIAALTEALQRAAEQPALRAVIVTGEGAFCAGADLLSLRTVVDDGPVGPELYETAHMLIRTLVSIPVPTIAALDGPAVGMGADLALACDCRLFGPEGWLRQGWAARGAIPATGGLLFLRKLAPGVIWRLLDGQPKIGPEAAERLGLGEAVSGSSALAAAERRAISYADIPAEALAAYVKLSRRDIARDLDAELETCAVVQAELFNRPTFSATLSPKLDSENGQA